MNVFETLFQEGKGIFRLKPTWVPRSFCRPGQRLKLDPRDLYVYGTERGAIDERWFASTTPADNGPGTPSDEGLSYIVSAACRKSRGVRKTGNVFFPGTAEQS